MGKYSLRPGLCTGLLVTQRMGYRIRSVYLPVIVASLYLTTFAKQIYVQGEGSDATGLGNLDRPVATLVRAYELVNPHDTITFRQGTYAGHDMIDKPYLTLRGYPGENAHISNPYGSGSDVTLRFWSKAHHAVVENLEISGGDIYTVMFYSDWDYGPNRAHSGRIEGCDLHSSGYDVIKITPECDDIVISNCKIHNSGLYFLQNEPENEWKNCQAIDNVNADRMHVRDCHIHDIPSIGIFFKGGATDCIIERVLVERAQMGLVFGGNTDIEFHDTTTNPQYYQAIRGTIRNCIVKDTWVAGIGYFSTRECRAYNNTLINCGNTNEGVGLFFGLDGAHTADGVPVMPSNSDMQFINNVVIRNSREISIWDNWMIYFRGDDVNGPAIPPGALAADNNLYWDPHHPDSFHVRDRNSPGEVRSYFSFDEWKSLPIHVGSFGDRNSHYVDPVIDSNGVPQVNSPCRANGRIVSGLEDDFYGNRRGTLVDIGAIQVTDVAIQIPWSERGIPTKGPRGMIRAGRGHFRLILIERSPMPGRYVIRDLRGRTVDGGFLHFRKSANGATATISLNLLPGAYILDTEGQNKSGTGIPFVLHSR